MKAKKRMTDPSAVLEYGLVSESVVDVATLDFDDYLDFDEYAFYTLRISSLSVSTNEISLWLRGGSTTDGKTIYPSDTTLNMSRINYGSTDNSEHFVEVAYKKDSIAISGCNIGADITYPNMLTVTFYSNEGGIAFIVDGIPSDHEGHPCVVHGGGVCTLPDIDSFQLLLNSSDATFSGEMQLFGTKTSF